VSHYQFHYLSLEIIGSEIMVKIVSQKLFSQMTVKRINFIHLLHFLRFNPQLDDFPIIQNNDAITGQN